MASNANSAGSSAAATGSRSSMAVSVEGVTLDSIGIRE